MLYSDMLVGFLLIVILALAAYHLLASSPKPAPDRTLWRDAQGRLVAIGDHERSHGQLSGTGTQTSDLLSLAAGAYRLDYQFDVLTRLAFLDANGDETLLIKSGTGTEGFTITEAGRYRLRVEPSDEGASWNIAYRQINTGANQTTVES